MKPLKIAISPCPNDTFLFYGWISGQIEKHFPVDAVYADIKTLNEWAMQGIFPLIKISFGCYPSIADRYEILPIGSALGFDSGPKLIAKQFFPLDEMAEKKIAIPGITTTAYLLLSKLIGAVKNKVVCLYHEIFDLLDKEEADAGLIIHESRFTYAQRNFVEIADLGKLWQDKTQLPLPLGALAIKRELPLELKQKISHALRQSLLFGWKNRQLGKNFILNLSQEKDWNVVAQHIDLYVNQETAALSETGVRAIETLLGIEKTKWLFS